MKAKIRLSGQEAFNLISEKEVFTLGQLDDFLQEHGLIRNIEDLREDLKWNQTDYFVPRLAGNS